MGNLNSVSGVGEMAEWSAPGYTDIRQLGAGATGRVVLARHDSSGRLVALKYLAPALVGDPAFAQRFRREAELMALVRDPNVVEVYELAIAPDGRGVALVMEAVEGPTLRRLLSSGHGSPEAALTLLRGSLLGLAAAHDRGVVHRDYKPDNVLVTPAGASKLTDFGIAVPAGSAGAAVEGTPAYMAPEQWNGYPPAPASDMYSAAVVFYECLTGVRPFRSDTMAELRTLHESAPVPLDQVPPPVRGLLERGLAKYPQQRYGDVRSFVTDVENAAVVGYGPQWLERGARDLGFVAAGMIAALPLLALGAGALGSTAAAGSVGAAGAAGSAGAAAGGAVGGAAGAAGTAAGGAVGGAASAAGQAGAQAAGQAATQAAGHVAMQAGGQAATQAAGNAAMQAGGQGAASAAQGAGHAAMQAGHAGGAQAAGHLGMQGAGHAGAQAGHEAAGHAAHQAHQAIDHTRRAAKWSRRGAKLLHGKALAATVATVTVAAAGTTVAVVAASSSSSDPQHAVASAEESAFHTWASGDYQGLCRYFSKQLLDVYGGPTGCSNLMKNAGGFINALGPGANIDAYRAAFRTATVDASKVVVSGDTATVSAAAVHMSQTSVTIVGQPTDIQPEDLTWVKEGGKWLLGVPKSVSNLPTGIFSSGSIPTDLFPSSIPSDLVSSLLSNLPTDVTLPSNLPTDLPTDIFPTQQPTS